MGIGLFSQGVNMNRLPGWDKNSFGYYGDDGHSFCSSGSGHPYGPQVFFLNELIYFIYIKRVQAKAWCVYLVVVIFIQLFLQFIDLYIIVMYVPLIIIFL